MKIINTYAYILFGLILILAALLRGQEIWSGNFLFLIDQGRDLVEVKKIVFDHDITLIGPYTSLQGVFQGPLYYYLLAVPLFLLNGNPWGPMFLMFLISMSVVAVVFFWMRRLFGILIALVASFLFAVSSEAISAATYIWNPHPMWLLIVIYILGLYELVLGRLRFHFIVWSILSLMFHFESALAVFLSISTCIYLILFSRKSFVSKSFFLGLGIGFLFFIPQIVFDLKHDFLMTRSVFAVFSGSDQGLFVTNEQTSYLRLLNSHTNEFLLNFRSAFPIMPYSPQLWILYFIVLLFGIFYILKREFYSSREQVFICVLTGIMSILYLLTFLYPFPIRYWFLTGIQSIYLLIFALISVKIVSYKLGKVILIFVGILFVMHSLFQIQKNFSSNDYGGTAKLRGKLDAIEYVYKDAKFDNFGLFIFTPPVHTYAYDYLIWWKGERAYGFIPHQKQEGTFYLLMEPDPHQPWSYRGWRETVMKTGKPIKTVTLPSGIIIEKHYAEKD